MKAPALFLVLSLVLFLGSCSPPSRLERMSHLERDVRYAAARSCPGVQLSLWLCQADGREILAIDADRPLPAASTLKVLVLVEGYAQQIEGGFRWTDEYTLQASDLVRGSGSFQREPVGSSWTYLQFARRMISESDNTAAGILIRRLKGSNLNRRAERLGLVSTRFEREAIDLDEPREGRANVTTARETGQLLRAIFRREILTKEACDEMIGMLERTSRGRIAAGVPKSIPVGHKGGAMPGYRHDAGWVRLPGQPYVLSVFLANVYEARSGEEDRGTAGIEAVARAVFEAMGPSEE